MKRFLRTVFCKTVSFILCVVSLVMSAASIVAIVMMFNENIYGSSEESFSDMMIKREVIPYGYNYIAEYVDNGITQFKAEDSGLVFEIRDKDNNAVAETYRKLTLGSSWNGKIYFNAEVYANGSFIMVDPEYEAEYGDPYTFYYFVPNNSVIAENNELISNIVSLAFYLRYRIYAILAASLVVLIASSVLLLNTAARRPVDDELHAGTFSKIPFDVIFVLSAISVVFISGLTDSALHDFNDDLFGIVICIAVGIVVSTIIVALAVCCASRIKLKTLFKTMLITVVCGYIIKSAVTVSKLTVKFISHIPMMWKTLLILAIISITELLVYSSSLYSRVILFIFWTAVNIIRVPVVVYISLQLGKLQKGAKELSEGDMSYKIQTDKMFGELKLHGERLNSVSDGMAVAVEEKVKSERMKTELITNVSHDIKTPLTSIINYATLIGKDEKLTDSSREYADVLVRQSERLKRLTEDLVEASKASSGNLDVELTACSAGIFITQVDGEYVDKLSESNLILITRQPEEPLYIMADGRRMWRIFDNIIGNATKYALEGTRVYLTLEQSDKNAVISLKNTSRDELNINPDELTERFVRGDLSRGKTEGNGLGLSIAKSLTELQGGEMKITVDGDLFKVMLLFPIIQ